MKDEYEGKDLEEAIGHASADLGIPAGELHYEVLEQGRKGLLGLGMKNVRIRVMRPVEHLTDSEILNGEEPAGMVVAPDGADAGEAGRAGGARRRRRSGRSRGAGPGSVLGSVHQAQFTPFSGLQPCPERQ